MWFRYFLIVLIFFTAVLLQVSFLPYFNIMGAFPNAVLLAFFFYMLFFETSDRVVSNEGFFGALVAGFFLDIFSYKYYGFYMVLFLFLYLLVKTALHFLQERQDTYFILYFLFLFLLYFFVFKISENIILHSFNVNFLLTKMTIATFIYNLVFTFLLFYCFNKLPRFNNRKKQLTLFT